MRSALLAAAIAASGLLSTFETSRAVTPSVMLGIRPNADGTCDIADPSNCEYNLQTRETEIGRQFAILSEYGPFDVTSIPSLWWAATNGRTPMYTMQHIVNGNGCTTAYDIVNHVYDTQITAWANYFATFPTKVILRLFPEMNKEHQACMYTVDPVVDPVTAGAEFVQAWQYIHNLAAPIAPNIVWDWSPGGDAFDDNSGNPVTIWQDFDPGNAYVDYRGSQIYNGGTTAVAITSSPKFFNWYSQQAPLGLPLFMSETGAVDVPGAFKDPQQSWYFSMSQNLRNLYPLVIGLVVFDVLPPPGDPDYRLGGDGETAFTNMGAKPYFQKMSP